MESLECTKVKRPAGPATGRGDSQPASVFQTVWIEVWRSRRTGRNYASVIDTATGEVLHVTRRGRVSVLDAHADAAAWAAAAAMKEVSQ